MRLRGRSDLGFAAAGMATAAGMVLGTPAYDVWWLGFFAWIPWLWMAESTTPRRAFLHGWLCGTMTVFVGFRWMTELMVRFGGFPPAGGWGVTLLFAASHGLLWAIPAWLIARMGRPGGTSVLLIAPLSWTACEALLPNIFPIYMAQMWSSQPLWIQTAELGGVTTVSCSMLAINAALWVVLRTALAERRLHRTAAAVALGLLMAIPAYGALRMAQVDALIADSPKLRIGVVQGNMSIQQMMRSRERPRILEAHKQMSAELERQGAELLLWGETAYPYAAKIERRGGHDWPVDHPARVRGEFTVPLVFGALTEDPEEPYGYNTAMVLDREGRVGDLYDKVYLLMFGEYVPLVDPDWFLSLVPSAAHLNRGPGPSGLRVDDRRFGTLICYEDILPRYARASALEGIHAFVNLTNDAWFGKTHEPFQHLGLAMFRAIEQRRALVRAVNTGTSSYVDPAGRIVISTEVTDPEVEGPQPPTGFVVDVPMIEPGRGETPYRWTGELFDGLAVLGLGLVAARGRTARGRRRVQTPVPTVPDPPTGGPVTSA